MSNNGKYGERLFSQRMAAQGFLIQDVSGNSAYFDKDIDFIVTNPTTGNVRAFEVKYDEKLNRTGNLFLEIENPRSKQWSGQGWWLHCKADFLVYGNGITQELYCFPLLELKERVKGMNLRTGRTWDNSVGLLCPLDRVKDLAIQL